MNKLINCGKTKVKIKFIEIYYVEKINYRFNIRNCKRIFFCWWGTYFSSCIYLLDVYKRQIEGLTDLKVNKIRINSQSGNLQKYLGNNLNAYERDIERPKIIKQIILEN